MVSRAAVLAALMVSLAAPVRAAEIDLAAWAAGLPAHFSLSGSKLEPTYAAAIDISRDGDRVAIRGGAPAWMARSLEAVRIAADGTITHDVCPPGMRCTGAARPAGFLSTAALISADRRQRLAGSAATTPFGRWTVVCIPGEKLGIERPILDPCFEIGTGAAIAQRHRNTGRFDGPTLDPATLRFDPVARSLSVNPKDKAS